MEETSPFCNNCAALLLAHGAQSLRDWRNFGFSVIARDRATAVILDCSQMTFFFFLRSLRKVEFLPARFGPGNGQPGIFVPRGGMPRQKGHDRPRRSRSGCAWIGYSTRVSAALFEKNKKGSFVFEKALAFISRTV
jgi:hypothetical protein